MPGPTFEDDDEAGLVAKAQAGDNAVPLTITEISNLLKRTVEDRFGFVRLRGELSGVKRAASGHLYCCLKDEGAVKVVAYITHAILSGNAVEKILKSALDELVVTDTIPLSAAAKQSGRIRQLSVAGLLAETIRRIRDEDSVSSLYLD